LVKIRLARRGSKGNPYYHIVVADARAPRDGKYIEKIGFYNPMVKENRFDVNMERAKHWISVGAQLTVRVEKLIKQQEAQVA